MNIIDQQSDSLEINEIKKHLYIDHNLDDQLLDTYRIASLEVAQSYLHNQVLETLYENETHELEPVNYGLSYEFRIPYRPKELVLWDIEDNPITIFYEQIQYDPGTGILHVFNNFDITKAQALTGYSKDTQYQINIARLLMIGEWYKYRENSQSLNLSEISFGTKLLLDMIQGSFL